MDTTRTDYYRRKRSRAAVALWVVGAGVALFILIQLVPYGREHTDPAASAPFRWSSPQAQVIAKRSCYDCHSDRTKWWRASR